MLHHHRRVVGALIRSAARSGRRAASTQRVSTPASASMPHHMAWSAADVQLNPQEVREAFRSMAMEDDEKHNEMVYSQSFARDQAEDEAAWKFSVLTDPRMQAQLKQSQDQLKKQQPTAEVSQSEPLDTAPLPQSLEEALHTHSKRAIVVTEATAPFRIVNVNNAWQDLCGYSYVESKGQSLGELLRGPETDRLASTALISKLLQGEEAGTVLVNYTKTGRRFQNRVRVGPLYDANHNVSHFVGVLQEMKM